MCDACDSRLDRRALLKRAGIGGLVAVTGGSLLSSVADAFAPPFEALAMGEDLREALAPARDARPAPRAAATGRVAAPAIISRAQWGADESIRVKGSLGYAPTRKLVVHHSASANRPRDPVDIVRYIYKHHVLDRGFADMGYNYVIDHRGVIYEGRWARSYDDGDVRDGEIAYGYGVSGAHAVGVNTGSCGVCLIGNFARARPSDAALGSLVHLLAWKASRNRIAPKGSDDYISLHGRRRTFPNIVGHGGVGETACPGSYLNDLLPTIRAEVRRRTGDFPAATVDMTKVAWFASPSPSRATSGASSASSGSSAGVGRRTLVAYRLLGAKGSVLTVGKLETAGQPRDSGRRGVAIAGVPQGSGYYTVEATGGVQAFGGAPGHGSPGKRVSAVDISVAPAGNGYWVLTAEGGVYAYGAARHHGSHPRSGIGVGARKLRPTPAGAGYWILGVDGRLRAFGDARDLGSPRSASAIDFWPTPTGRGYWVLFGDGSVRTYGDAPHHGDLRTTRARFATPAKALIGMPSGRGYLLCSADGGLFNFGSAPFLGSLGGGGRSFVGVAAAFV